MTFGFMEHVLHATGVLAPYQPMQQLVLTVITTLVTLAIQPSGLQSQG
jgi:hypothetical protein